MKRKLFMGIAAVLLISGLMMLIAPRISNRVGEQIAHTTIEDFKALKSKSTYDEPTEKEESSEESTKRDDSEAESLRVRQKSRLRTAYRTPIRRKTLQDQITIQIGRTRTKKVSLKTASWLQKLTLTASIPTA